MATMNTEFLPKSVHEMTVLQYFLYQEVIYLLSKNQDLGEMYGKMQEIFPNTQLLEIPIMVGKTKEQDGMAILNSVHYGKKCKLSLLGIFDYLDQIIRAYEPGQILSPEFEHFGKVYKLHDKVVGLSEGSLAPISAGEIVVIQELKRALSKNKEITDVDYDFTLTTKAMALLFLQTPNEVPLLVVDREKWLEERAKEFENAPATLALWLRFFFTQRLTKYWISLGMLPYLRGFQHSLQTQAQIQTTQGI